MKAALVSQQARPNPRATLAAKIAERDSARSVLRESAETLERANEAARLAEEELGKYEGRVKQGPELAEMASEYGEFRVYVVEVCQSCAWNHLASSYVLGTGEPRTRRGRRVRAGD